MSTFIGLYRYSVDSKGRLSIPAEFRKILSPESDKDSKESEKFVLTRGFDLSLVVYPMRTWDVVTQENARLNYGDKKIRYYMRRLNPVTTNITFDRQGRIVLSKERRKIARITNEAVVVGTGGSHFEIFSPEVYEEYLAGTLVLDEDDRKFEEAMQRALELIQKARMNALLR